MSQFIDEQALKRTKFNNYDNGIEVSMSGEDCHMSRTESECFDQIFSLGSNCMEFQATAVLPDKQLGEILINNTCQCWVALFFYERDFSCANELINFEERILDFRAIGVEFIAASADSKYSHLAWINMCRMDGGLGPVSFPIIADFDKQLSKQFGVLQPDGFPRRSLFVLSPQYGVAYKINVSESNLNVEDVFKSIQVLIRNYQAS